MEEQGDDRITVSLCYPRKIFYERSELRKLTAENIYVRTPYSDKQK